jgi:hypothetical protein
LRHAGAENAPFSLVECESERLNAHTRHHNHSREFWQLVAAHVPDYRAKRRELQRLWNAVEI